MKRLLAVLAACIVLLHSNAQALSLYFWDINGPTPGAGGAMPTGTWGVDAYWSKDDNSGNAGTQSTVAWPAGNYAVFSAGNDATGAYVVNVSGLVQVADIHVDLGQVTFKPAAVGGGSLSLIDGNGGNTNRQLSVGQKDPNAVATYNVVLSGATNIIRYKRGTVVFGATNTYTGSTTIEGGVIQISVPNAIPTNSQLVLANNDTSRTDFNPAWQFTPAVFATGGLNQKLGTLLLSGSDASVTRMIDFGNGSSAVAFDDSSGQDWSGFVLTIANYTPGVDSLRFGTSAAGLTPVQLSQMQFADFGNLPGTINSLGFVTPALPMITSIVPSGMAPSGLSFTVNWVGLSGRTYRVQSRDSLGSGTWADLSGDISGDAPSFTDQIPGTKTRYYRVRLLP